MIEQVEAVYENGLLRPLAPLALADRQKVTLTISRDDGESSRTHFALTAESWDAFSAALDAAPRAIPALRKLLTEPGVFDGPATAQ